jgi:hypothetical protein
MQCEIQSWGPCYFGFTGPERREEKLLWRQMIGWGKSSECYRFNTLTQTLCGVPHKVTKSRLTQKTSLSHTGALAILEPLQVTLLSYPLLLYRKPAMAGRWGPI